jgi:hypothetical protein
MHLLFSFCQWLEQTWTGTTIRNSGWLFQVIETIHIIGIVAVMGSTSVLDLRLMGLMLRDEPVSKLAGRYLQTWTWAGFAVMAVTGFLMFASEATKLYGNLGFQIKMLLLVAAGVNAFVFDRLAYRSIGTWDDAPLAPLSARIAGCLSLLLWFGIVAAGRWIAYV